MGSCKFTAGLMFSFTCAVASGHAAATSFVALRPHEPATACQAIEAVVAEMTGQQPSADLWPIYYSDTFGNVEYGERAAFIESMTHSEGRVDKSTIELTDVWPVAKRRDDQARALYVVQLERVQWHSERESSFDPMQTEPEGFEATASFWLVEFSENRIVTMREGFAFFDFVEYDNRLKGCGRHGR